MKATDMYKDRQGDNVGYKTLFFVLSKRHLVLGLQKLFALVNAGMLPLFVLDGKQCLAKCMRLKIQTVRLGQLQTDLIRFCEKVGVPWLTAEGEAEATLAALENYGKVNIQSYTKLISDCRHHLI
jgi:hypothetical protein